jgi:hypothetical protein
MKGNQSRKVAWRACSRVGPDQDAIIPFTRRAVNASCSEMIPRGASDVCVLVDPLTPSRRTATRRARWRRGHRGNRGTRDVRIAGTDPALREPALPREADSTDSYPSSSSIAHACSSTQGVGSDVELTVGYTFATQLPISIASASSWMLASSCERYTWR